MKECDVPTVWLQRADFSMLPPLERPKTLVDEEGNDLPSTKRTQHDSSSTQADGYAILLPGLSVMMVLYELLQDW